MFEIPAELEPAAIADGFAGVILPGVTGYVTSVAMSLAENRLLRWQAAQR
ncbi:hypothetical protein IVB30_20870 [Bradyrhizobium sp. 200]|nr:hypothetical protein IVB30_20870 [Bradyrhizobium sp. 200]